MLMAHLCVAAFRVVLCDTVSTAVVILQYKPSGQYLTYLFMVLVVRMCSCSSENCGDESVGSKGML